MPTLLSTRPVSSGSGGRTGTRNQGSSVNTTGAFNIDLTELQRSAEQQGRLLTGLMETGAGAYGDLVGQMQQPIGSYLRDLGARIKSSVGGETRNAVSNLASRLGGDTSSPLFAKLAARLEGGGAASVGGAMADAELNETARRQGMLQQLAALGLSGGGSVLGGGGMIGSLLDYQLGQGQLGLQKQALDSESSLKNLELQIQALNSAKGTNFDFANRYYGLIGQPRTPRPFGMPSAGGA